MGFLLETAKKQPISGVIKDSLATISGATMSTSLNALIENRKNPFFADFTRTGRICQKRKFDKRNESDVQGMRRTGGRIPLWSVHL
nr:unnamed protein product [Callosobruchus chinensis]